MVPTIIADHQEFFQASVDHFVAEAAKLRTGRAHPSLVEGILVSYYGARTPLMQVASVSVPEARQILIQPWDRGALVDIESALRESDLGLNPVNDGANLRLNLPQLTEERRKDLVKLLNARAEEARIAIRTTREDIWKAIQDAEKSGEISEDDKFTGKETLQKVIDDFNGKIEEIRKAKEQEILTL